MADNDLKIWQNRLFTNPFHMVDAKFDLILRPISHGNPVMPFNNKKFVFSNKLIFLKIARNMNFFVK